MEASYLMSPLTLPSQWSLTAKTVTPQPRRPSPEPLRLPISMISLDQLRELRELRAKWNGLAVALKRRRAWELHDSENEALRMGQEGVLFLDQWSLVPSGLTPYHTMNCKGRVYRPSNRTPWEEFEFGPVTEVKEAEGCLTAEGLTILLGSVDPVYARWRAIMGMTSTVLYSEGMPLHLFAMWPGGAVATPRLDPPDGTPLPDPPASPPESEDEEADESKKVSERKRDLTTYASETLSEVGELSEPAPHLSDAADSQATESSRTPHSSRMPSVARRRQRGVYPYEISEPRALQEIALRTTASNKPKGLDEIVRVPGLSPREQRLGAPPTPHPLRTGDWFRYLVDSTNKQVCDEYMKLAFEIKHRPLDAALIPAAHLELLTEACGIGKDLSEAEQAAMTMTLEAHVRPMRFETWLQAVDFYVKHGLHRPTALHWVQYLEPLRGGATFTFDLSDPRKRCDLPFWKVREEEDGGVMYGLLDSWGRYMQRVLLSSAPGAMPRPRNERTRQLEPRLYLDARGKTWFYDGMASMAREPGWREDDGLGTLPALTPFLAECPNPSCGLYRPQPDEYHCAQCGELLKDARLVTATRWQLSVEAHWRNGGFSTTCGHSEVSCLPEDPVLEQIHRDTQELALRGTVGPPPSCPPSPPPSAPGSEASDPEDEGEGSEDEGDPEGSSQESGEEEEEGYPEFAEDTEFSEDEPSRPPGFDRMSTEVEPQVAAPEEAAPETEPIGEVSIGVPNSRQSEEMPSREHPRERQGNAAAPLRRVPVDDGDVRGRTPSGVRPRLDVQRSPARRYQEAHYAYPPVPEDPNGPPYSLGIDDHQRAPPEGRASRVAAEPPSNSPEYRPIDTPQALQAEMRQEWRSAMLEIEEVARDMREAKKRVLSSAADVESSAAEVQRQMERQTEHLSELASNQFDHLSVLAATRLETYEKEVRNRAERVKDLAEEAKNLAAGTDQTNSARQDVAKGGAPSGVAPQPETRWTSPVIPNPQSAGRPETRDGEHPQEREAHPGNRSSSASARNDTGMPEAAVPEPPEDANRSWEYPESEAYRSGRGTPSPEDEVRSQPYSVAPSQAASSRHQATDRNMPSQTSRATRPANHAPPQSSRVPPSTERGPPQTTGAPRPQTFTTRPTPPVSLGVPLSGLHQTGGPTWGGGHTPEEAGQWAYPNPNFMGTTRGWVDDTPIIRLYEQDVEVTVEALRDSNQASWVAQVLSADTDNTGMQMRTRAFWTPEVLSAWFRRVFDVRNKNNIDTVAKMSFPNSLRNDSPEKVALGWQQFRPGFIATLRECFRHGCRWEHVLQKLLGHLFADGGRRSPRILSATQEALQDVIFLSDDMERGGGYALLGADIFIYRLDQSFVIKKGGDLHRLEWSKATFRLQGEDMFALRKRLGDLYFKYSGIPANEVHMSTHHLDTFNERMVQCLRNDPSDKRRGKTDATLYEELVEIATQAVQRGRQPIDALRPDEIVETAVPLRKGRMQACDVNGFSDDEKGEKEDDEGGKRSTRKSKSRTNPESSQRETRSRKAKQGAGMDVAAVTDYADSSSSVAAVSPAPPPGRGRQPPPQRPLKMPPPPGPSAGTSAKGHQNSPAYNQELPPQRYERRSDQGADQRMQEWGRDIEHPSGSKGHPNGKEWTAADWNSTYINYSKALHLASKTPDLRRAMARFMPQDRTMSAPAVDVPEPNQPPQGDRPAAWRRWPAGSCAFCAFRPQSHASLPPWALGAGRGDHPPMTCRAAKRWLAEGGDPETSHVAKELQSCLYIRPRREGQPSRGDRSSNSNR